MCVASVARVRERVADLADTRFESPLSEAEHAAFEKLVEKVEIQYQDFGGTEVSEAWFLWLLFCWCVFVENENKPLVMLAKVTKLVDKGTACCLACGAGAPSGKSSFGARTVCEGCKLPKTSAEILRSAYENEEMLESFRTSFEWMSSEVERKSVETMSKFVSRTAKCVSKPGWSPGADSVERSLDTNALRLTTMFDNEVRGLDELFELADEFRALKILISEFEKE
jgi:hypothetical protein